MKKIYVSFLALMSAMLITANVAASEAEVAAEEPEVMLFDTVITESDTIIRHVHPQPGSIDMRHLRKAAASLCGKTDSIIGLDTLGNYVSKEEFKYDDAGHTIFYAKHTWTNGVIKGVQRYKQEYSGSTVTMKVNYSWTNGAWVPKDSMQLHYYTEAPFTGKERRKETYLWTKINEVWKWRDSTLYEYEYDANSKQTTLSRYSTWNKSDNALRYNNRWVYEYDSQGRETCNAYWTYSSDWVGSTMHVTGYDTAGNTNLTEDYNSYADGKWKGDGSKGKHTYVFNANKDWTEHIRWKWSSNVWVQQYKYSKEYDGDDVTDDASYYYNGSKWIGSARTSTTYYAPDKIKTELVWRWPTENVDNPDWVKDALTEYVYATGKDTVRHSNWTGTWTKAWQLVTTYTSGKKTLEETQAWHDDWKDSLRSEYHYNIHGNDSLTTSAKMVGDTWTATDSVKWTVTYWTNPNTNKIETTKKTLEMKEQWSASTTPAVWKGLIKSEWTYDTNGNNIQSDTYTFQNENWVNNVRREYTYKKTNTGYKQTSYSYMVYNSTKGKWSGATTKTENDYNEAGTPIMTATYKWNASHEGARDDWAGDWEGISKTEDVYEGSIKTTSYSSKWDYKTWNWTGMFRTDYVRDSKNRVIDQTLWRYNADAAAYVYDTHYTYEYDALHDDAVKSIVETWVAANNNWCYSSYKETSYDKMNTNRIRFVLDMKYTDCEISNYDMKRYYYQCDQYDTIRFVNWDNTVLDVQVILEGETPYYDFDVNGTPTREADEQQTYKFKDWDKPLAPATADVTYTAVYTSTPRKYTVTFYNDDHTILTSGAWSYNDMPTCAEPSKTGTAQYTFKFLGWGEGIKPVAKDTSYTAVFDTIVNRYAVDFYNEEVRIVRDSVAYGVTPVYSGETPTKAGNAQYTYTFNGWNHALAPVTGDATYKAVFTETVNEYDITFYDEDATTVLESKKCAYGTTPTYTGTTPTKTGDAQYTYTFNGWNPQIVIVSGEVSYKAQYSQTLNTYNITFEVKGNPALSYTVPNVEYGTLVNSLADAVKAALGGETFEDEQYIYTYAGLENVSATTIVEGTATYYVLYTKTEKQVTPTDVEMIEGRERATKVVIDGVMYIQRDGKLYYVTGAEVR